MNNIKTVSFLFFLFLVSIKGSGQTSKTGVLVIGGTPAGLAAAIQSAHSGVKTFLIDKGNWEAVVFSEADKASGAGVYAGFLKRVEAAQKYPVTKTQTFSPSFTAMILKAWTDTIKNLSIMTKASVSGIEKSGKDWQVLLSDRRLIKTDVIVDASADKHLLSLASVKTTNSAIIPLNTDSAVYASKKYRTSVAVIPSLKGYPGLMPLSYLTSESENYIIVSPQVNTDVLSAGQAAGAAAAFCSFFKTTTKKLNVRTIQSELIGFNSRLMRFDDISDLDSNAVAIQSMALTGILKGKDVSGKFLFLPDSALASDDIKLAVKEYYSRSQIWFLDNRANKLSVNDALSLIKFIASRGEELNKEVEKAWSRSLKLKGSFSLSRPVSRKEFAVLFHTYVKPFNVSVDMDGVLRR